MGRAWSSAKLGSAAENSNTEGLPGADPPEVLEEQHVYTVAERGRDIARRARRRGRDRRASATGCRRPTAAATRVVLDGAGELAVFVPGADHHPVGRVSPPDRVAERDDEPCVRADFRRSGRARPRPRRTRGSPRPARGHRRRRRARGRPPCPSPPAKVASKEKEMRLLERRHEDVRMLVEVPPERRRAAALDPSHEEVRPGPVGHVAILRAGEV